MDKTENTRIFLIVSYIVFWVAGAFFILMVSCDRPTKPEGCKLPPRYEIGEQVIIDGRIIATVQEFLRVECSKGWYRVEVHIDLGRAGAVPQQSVSMVVDTTRMKPYKPEC